MAAKKKIAVIVRDHRAGVYFGYLEDYAPPLGQTVRLQDARHIYYWSERLSTSDIAARGVGKDSKVVAPVTWIELRDVVSVAACSEEAAKSIADAKPWAR